MNEHEWETIYVKICDTLLRLKVEGGWLYRSIIIIRGQEMVTMCFVPDSKPEKIDEIKNSSNEIIKAIKQKTDEGNL